MSLLDHLRWIDPSDRCFMSNVLLFLIDSKTELPRPHRDDNLYICTCTQRKIWSVGDTEALIRVWRETLTPIRQVLSLGCFMKLTYRAFSMALDGLLSLLLECFYASCPSRFLRRTSSGPWVCASAWRSTSSRSASRRRGASAKYVKE